jgi:hypothetical protein
MSLGTDTDHLEMNNGDITTGCTELSTWEPYLPKTEETLKMYVPG